MRKIVMLLVLVLHGGLVAEVSDADIVDTMVYAAGVFDNPDYARRMFEKSIRVCGYDTNRYVRILMDMARTNDTRVAKLGVSRLGRYGGEAQLPFLYSCVSNEALRSSALLSIVRIGHCDAASVGLFSSYLSNTNVPQSARSAFACELYASAFTNKVPVSERAQWAACVDDYAVTAKQQYFTSLDDVMVWANPAYRHSKRRLAVLRSVRDLGMQPYPLAYVTNAINELVSYPEADLPD